MDPMIDVLLRDVGCGTYTSSVPEISEEEGKADSRLPLGSAG